LEELVTKKIYLIAFALVVLFLTFSTPTVAQNTNPCLAYTTWWFPDPMPPGFFYYGPYPGGYVYLIATWTAACSPPAFCPKCPIPLVSQPVSLATGDTFIEEVDAKIPGLGGGLNVTRTWHSVWPPLLAAYSIGIFGPSWHSTYEEKIVIPSDNYIRYIRGDGSVWVFGSNAGTFQVASPANYSATLTSGTTTWVLTFQNGEQRQFDLATGHLNAIIDRNGNTTQLTYDSSNRLVTVTSPASQHLYFNYQNGSSFLVTSLTSDFGLTLSYAYDTEGRLIQVTRPDLTTISFTYNTQSQITQVTDSNGKILESHTYDSNGRGLTSSQANGVNAVTVTYLQ
jgi:YD repeat-containing protein